jgi:hypothetical protein
MEEEKNRGERRSDREREKQWKMKMRRGRCEGTEKGKGTCGGGTL